MFTILPSFASMPIFAYDISVENTDGVTIYYNYINDGKELEVTQSNKYYYYKNAIINIPNEVNIGKTLKVTSIGKAAFGYCGNIISITLPTCLTTIGASAFEGCNNLTSIEIPNSVTTINNSAFRSCTTLKKITIPNSVSFIGEAAFYECRALSSVTIEYGLTSISDYCFAFCSSLSTINLPNSLVSIGNNAFFNCTNLLSCTMPNNVKTIGSYAFYGCKHMKSFVIGNGCNYIDYSVFGDCFYLDDVYCYADVVPNTHDAVFGFSYVGYATLHVPSAALQAYKSSITWSKFGKIVALTNSDPKPTKIISIGNVERSAIENYSIDGKHLYTPFKGISIVKMNDGTIRKIMIK